MTRAVPFADCCGARTIIGFYNDEEQTERELKVLLKQYGSLSFISVILCPDQWDFYEPILEKFGFKLLSEGYNVIHTDNLRFYLYTNPSKKKINRSYKPIPDGLRKYIAPIVHV